MIKSMQGMVTRSRAYSNDGFELRVTISFDAKVFNSIKKKSCPLARFMPQIKNVVLDATGVRGTPSYSRPSYSQQYPRTSKGLVTLDVYFDVSEFNAQSLGVDLKAWSVYQQVDLNSTLESTRGDGHMFAKNVICEKLFN
jgi:hypothetical protein